MVELAATAAESLPVSGSRSFTLSAYLRVFKVWSQLFLFGATHVTITVRELFPTNPSFNTCVSLLPRNGMRFIESPVARARITSFKASNDLLISAPSIRVVRQVLAVSAPRSEPARSMNDSRPIKERSNELEDDVERC